MRQLARRLQCLECTCTFVDVHRSFTRLVHEAALEVDLPPVCHQQLAAAIDARLHAVRQILPASFTHERQIATMVREVCQAVRSVVDTVVDEPQRYGLYTALSQACPREACRRRRTGMSRPTLASRVARLEVRHARTASRPGLVVVWLEAGETRAMALQRAGWTPAMLTNTIVLYVEYGHWFRFV